MRVHTQYSQMQTARSKKLSCFALLSSHWDVPFLRSCQRPRPDLPRIDGSFGYSRNRSLERSTDLPVAESVTTTTIV